MTQVLQILIVFIAFTRHIDGDLRQPRSNRTLRSNYQQLLLKDLFLDYEKDANPEGSGNSHGQTCTMVTFAAKLIRLIELNERANTIQTQWWIQQEWVNKDLSWDKSQYGNVSTVHVSPTKVWTPDILLYNSAEENDRLGGGTDKYKTQIAISSDGKHRWLAPVMFKSICDINTRFFPFDDQTCMLIFGSWAFDKTQLDMEINQKETGAKKEHYRTNTEWELLKFGVERHEDNYSCCEYPYASVHLKVSLRRRYYYYLVNLVVPCSLIAVMVLLSFVLPPEAGERISLGITVLMAMAIFQELTSEKLPVESTHTPLLAQYYSSAIAEIGLAIFATSVILNFHYRKSKMQGCLRKLIFSFLGPLVGMKKCQDTPKHEKFLRRNVKKSSDNDNYLKDNCELKSLSLLQNDSVSNECEARNECQSGKHLNNIRETHITDDGEFVDQYCRRGEDQDDKDINESYAKEWQEAARILDRFILMLAVVISVTTFAVIFIQSPRVKENLFGHPAPTKEQELGIGQS